jgi:hypothetical protein
MCVVPAQLSAPLSQHVHASCALACACEEDTVFHVVLLQWLLLLQPVMMSYE